VSIAVLGPVTFEVSSDKVRTWHEARRNGEARWVAHQVYAGKPVQEFLGPGLDLLNLTVRFDADRGLVPRDELRQLRKQRDTGAVLQFTIGGALVGDFIVRNLSEDLHRFSSKGVLLTAIVELSLEEYQ
jgi:phage protein U